MRSSILASLLGDDREPSAGRATGLSPPVKSAVSNSCISLSAAAASVELGDLGAATTPTTEPAQDHATVRACRQLVRSGCRRTQSKILTMQSSESKQAANARISAVDLASVIVLTYVPGKLSVRSRRIGRRQAGWPTGLNDCRRPPHVAFAG